MLKGSPYDLIFRRCCPLLHEQSESEDAWLANKIVAKLAATRRSELFPNEATCKMAQYLFVKRGEKISGPFTAEQILDLAAKKKFAEGDLTSAAKEGPYVSYLETIKTLEDSAAGETGKSADSKTADSEPPSIQWEYKRIMLPLHLAGDEADRMMNQMGWEGWELVGLSNHTGNLRRVGVESQSGGIANSAATIATQNAQIKLLKQHPGIIQTVAVFKRRLTEERKSQILSEAAGKQATSNG